MTLVRTDPGVWSSKLVDKWKAFPQAIAMEHKLIQRKIAMADLDRARSFIERYVIERASQFRFGKEQEDAWRASQDAAAIYEKMIAPAASRVNQREWLRSNERAGQAQQAGQTQPATPTTATQVKNAMQAMGSPPNKLVQQMVEDLSEKLFDSEGWTGRKSPGSAGI